MTGSRALRRYAGSLVGREGVLDALEAAVVTDGERLVTLLGPAGVGKTRLAIELARRMAPALDDGVYVVELRGLGPGRVADAMARAIEVRAATPQSLAHALDALGPVLLVLDDAEAHADELAARLPPWLAAAPAARFVVTSRVVLGVRDEKIFHVPLLGKPRDAGELSSSEAGRLFAERLASRGGRLENADDTARAAALLGRLGDLPLVVELLAAQVAAFGTRALVERLDHALDWLETDARDEPRRSLRCALDQSYALLDPAERSALARGSLFAGAFDADDAEAVLGPTALRSLRRLRDASWLAGGAPRDGRARFELLSPVREYLEPLREGALGAAGLADARARHARWALSRAEDPTLSRDELTAALRRAAAEPSLRSEALAALPDAFGAFASSGELHRFLELAEPLIAPDADPRARLAWARALRDTGRLEPARALLEGLLREAASDARLRAGVEGALASLYFKSGRYGEVEALRPGAVASDRPEEIEAFATAASIRGDADEAVRIYVAALASRDARLRPLDRAVLHACFARLLAELGLHARAREQLLRAEAASSALRPRSLAGSLAATRALLAHDAGRWDEALASYDEALACYRAPSAPLSTYIAFVRALAALQAGRTDEARAAFRAARERDNTAMVQLRPLAALGDWVVDGVAPAPLEIDDDVVRGTYRLFALAVACEQGQPGAAAALAEAQRAHEPAARWSVVTRACIALTRAVAPFGRAAVDALLVSADGRWFAAPGGQVVSLAHRPLLQRALRALSDAREHEPGAWLSSEGLAARVWPGERMTVQARKNRVYVAASSLRVMGLGALLEGTPAGYRLDPAVVFARR